MSIPASDSQHEFRVDRPGRYRLRDGNTAKVLRRAQYFGSPNMEWEGQIYTGKDWSFYAWGADGRAYAEREDWPNDLIAYLGPLEDEKRETLCWSCSKPYPMYDPWCPFCRATNANVDQETAQAEATAKTQPEGFITRLERELAESLAEITRLKLEIDALEKSRNHCEFCDREIAKPVPRVSIPLTTLTTEHYLSPLLGGERAR